MDCFIGLKWQAFNCSEVALKLNLAFKLSGDFVFFCLFLIYTNFGRFYSRDFCSEFPLEIEINSEISLGTCLYQLDLINISAKLIMRSAASHMSHKRLIWALVHFVLLCVRLLIFPFPVGLVPSDTFAIGLNSTPIGTEFLFLLKFF